ncbi:DUF5694 domain-containing protein [Marilutibacter chinensis]|uniref:DUF5694 domain-containing protein n=1 Tax=Marilutibacter chinensis TaxID=2912247 RepID=A0ABS9HQ18_9GAMM|nr:DUF5694 domain-containing protein [Lysobacter chinensis]MCF7220708.1 DUF5694 domain-containing protein [Lysobacter chinensis]
MGSLALTLMLPAAVQAQVDLTGLDADMSGQPARVLVLGSVHLSGMPEDFEPTSLEPVIERLAAFRPDIITIESMSGEECDLMVRHPKVYALDFCADTDAAEAATGLDVPAAIAEVREMLENWPDRPAPAQRRRLASRFLAANDRASALVQWWQLPESERRAGDGLDASLVEMLEALETRNNESYLIGARLAARLGLQRVHAVDNHTGDNLKIVDEETFGKDLMAAWNSDRTALDAAEQRQKELAEKGDMLGLYRRINRPGNLEMLADANAGTAMRFSSSGRYPQIWVAGWEIRNLRMIANIRESFRERPGVRVLSIVGVSHKPWFDAWLGQLQGVEIVDATEVLK